MEGCGLLAHGRLRCIGWDDRKEEVEEEVWGKWDAVDLEGFVKWWWPSLQRKKNILWQVCFGENY